MDRYKLKLISIVTCRQCLIMSTIDRGNLDNYLVDKSSIVCALTIRQIQFKGNELIQDLSFTRKSQMIQSNQSESKSTKSQKISTLTTLGN